LNHATTDAQAIAAGITIDLVAPHLPSTDGYQVLWPILGIQILAVIPLVRHMMYRERVNGTELRPAG